MSVLAVTGRDTIIINDRVIADFADADNAALTFPNDLMMGKTGKNGNAIITMNHAGRISELTLRLIRGSDDDKFLNDLQVGNQNNFPNMSVITGSLVKNIEDGAGAVSSDTYTMKRGFFRKPHPDSKENADGDVEQGVSIYTITFLDCDRSIG